MNIEIKKLIRQIYLIIAIIAVALLLLFWFFSRSFASIKVVPNTAKVIIDEATVRTTASGMAKKVTSPGLHQVRVEASGYVGVSKEISFGRGLMKTVTIELKKLPDPLLIGAGATQLTKGNGFNDGYYLGDGGSTIYKMKVGLDENGNVKLNDNHAITEARFSNIDEIIWSPTKELALLRKTSGEITLFDFMKYDFVHQTEIAWGRDIGSVAWAPDNSKIAYYYAPVGGEKSLIFANLTNTEVTRVADFKSLGIDNPILRWSPDSSSLLVIPRNSDSAQNKIYLFSIYSRTLKAVNESGNQADAMFSPDNNRILYATHSQDPASPVLRFLSVMKSDGTEQRSLDIRAELDKVAWSKDSRVIIVATYDSVTTQESIFSFDTEKKEKSGFTIKDLGNIFINSLIMSDDGNIITYQTKDGIYALKVE